MTIQDPTKTVMVNYDISFPEYKVKSKKFNPKWLINPFVVIGCAVLAILISYFGYKHGGELALLTSLYPDFMLGRIASLYIFDVENEFWNVEYEEVTK